MTDKDFFYRRRYEALLEATRGWPWQLAAFYAILLDVIYRFEGRLPDDLGTIRTWIGPDISRYLWEKFRGELIARGKLFVDDEGFLRNPKADELIATRAEERKEKSARFGEKSGDIFAKKNAKKSSTASTDLFSGNNAGCSPIGTKPAIVPARAPADSHSHRHSQDESSGGKIIEEVAAIATQLGQQRGRYWETDYRRMIEQDGLTFGDVLEAAKAHRGDPIKSMRALAGLARKKRDDRMAGLRPDEDPDPGAVTGTEPTDAEWREYLERLLRSGVWIVERHGPAPGLPGCRVPADHAHAFLLLWQAQGSHPLKEMDRNLHFVRYPADNPDPETRATWPK